MLMKYEHVMDLHHMKHMIVPADAIVKRKTLENFLTELSPLVQIQHQDGNGERIYTAEIVVMSKQHWDYVEHMIRVVANSFHPDHTARMILVDIINEIKFK
jgi:hypothetical protein